MFTVCRIGACDSDYVLVVMVVVEEVKVSVMEIVGVAIMLNLRMTALGTVLVSMRRMNVMFRHICFSRRSL